MCDPRRVFRPSSDAVFEHLERASRAGLEGVVRGMNGGLIGEVVRGAIFALECILEVEYAKGDYIPGLEITCFAPEFRGFW